MDKPKKRRKPVQRRRSRAADSGSNLLWQPQSTDLSVTRETLENLWKRMSLQQAVYHAIEHRLGRWESAQTQMRVTKLWGHYVNFALAQGVRLLIKADADKALAEQFVRARTMTGLVPSAATLRLRRSALRQLYSVLRELGAGVGDPTLDVDITPSRSAGTRPLTDEEVERCREASRGTLVETRQPAAWALAEAGATTYELAIITASDVDLQGERVRLPGGTHVEPRWAPLSAWGVEQLSQRVNDGRGERLIYEADGSVVSGQASSCVAISEIFSRAGLGCDKRVHPASVRAWLGAKILAEHGRIEDVALALGMRSLDQAAQAISFDWAASRTSQGNMDRE